jgi:type IV pilus assembly protein PilO
MPLSDYRFENLSRSTQIVVFSVLMLGLAVIFYAFYLKGMLEEKATLQKEVTRLEAAVAQAQAVEAQLAKFKKELAELEQRLEALKSMLPSQKETPSILRSVQQMAASNDLKILKFMPQPIVPRSFYVEWPITIDVEGTYNGLGLFFEKIGDATRIIDVGNFAIRGLEVSASPSRSIAATCTATTFVFREDQVAPTAK